MCIRDRVNIALNYGSKIELINTIKKIKQKKITINEKNIDKNLYTKYLPDPDILIRTGNTQRLSNFMLWQSAYSELVFQDILWPEFTKESLLSALGEYNKRDRRYGARP